jgi:glycosyltransferase involved in cell wall biosynthesis
MYQSFCDALQNHVTLTPTAETVVFMMQPKMIKGWYEGQQKVLMTMWETTELPTDMKELLSQFETVIVPSEHNRQVFAQHHDNVRVVPLGIDTDLWKPRKGRRRKGPYRFLAGGSNWKRKGLDAVVAAFSQIEGDAELHLKCKEDIIGGVPEIADPRVVLHREVMSEIEERDLYWDMDCFVSASRGEGWGLMPLQAIAAGLPTLMTATSGHQMFQHLAYALIDSTPVPCNETKLYNVGLWDEPDADDLVVKMREVMKTKPIVQSEEAANFSWDNAARELLKVVKPGRDLGDAKWVLSDTATVQVKALKKVEADIGRHRVRMAKGETQWISVNAKTVLLEAGAIILV